MIARSLTPFSKAINGYISSFAGVFSVILVNGILLAALGVGCLKRAKKITGLTGSPAVGGG